MNANLKLKRLVVKLIYFTLFKKTLFINLGGVFLLSNKILISFNHRVTYMSLIISITLVSDAKV